MTSTYARARVGDVVALIDDLYPPQLAEPWDSVGLIVGDPDDRVERVLVALDPVCAIGEEARSIGANFVLTHHPLYLRPTHSVATTQAKGRLVHQLIRSGCALMNAHTNADAQTGGVADILSDMVGMSENRVPLVANDDDVSVGIGRVGELREPCSLAEFAARVARVLPSTGGRDVER
ncbi:Nif3-like dinuclear metal center hexameric protein [Nanchangia anserum]|uniref:Nif3-like dinuclear metal center hexameric protein n=1 Tax=Nanchangia anserum TaxID=2692125 RepID=UPI0030B804EC